VMSSVGGAEVCWLKEERRQMSESDRLACKLIKRWVGFRCNFRDVAYPIHICMTTGKLVALWFWVKLPLVQ
jgi:hypothetical protein